MLGADQSIVMFDSVHISFLLSQVEDIWDLESFIFQSYSQSTSVVQLAPKVKQHESFNSITIRIQIFHSIKQKASSKHLILSPILGSCWSKDVGGTRLSSQNSSCFFQTFPEIKEQKDLSKLVCNLRRENKHRLQKNWSWEDHSIKTAAASLWGMANNN